MNALTDTITALAARLEQDGSLLYLQARIRGELDTIEGILAQGVSLRKLAEALAAAGVHQRGNRPLGYGHLRQLVTRARNSAAMPERPSAPLTHNRTSAQPTASGRKKRLAAAILLGTGAETGVTHAENFFTHRQRRQAAKAVEDARRPDFEEILKPKLSTR